MEGETVEFIGTILVFLAVGRFELYWAYTSTFGLVHKINVELDEKTINLFIVKRIYKFHYNSMGKRNTGRNCTISQCEQSSLILKYKKYTIGTLAYA